MNLSRKYRPRRFRDVVGQDHICITLQNELVGQKLAHAFLFCGPRGVGKTTLARILARAANCEQLTKVGESCHECAACMRHLDGKSIDVVEIDAASHTGVDNVRQEIIENVRFRPSQEKYKVFIIDEVHMLSGAAFNALLKTLEEPPERVLFIMATTEVYRLPDTIISRCQRFDFKKVSIQNIVGRLRELLHKEHRDVADDVLFEVARASGGCLRDAETFLDQVLVVKEGRIELDDARFILPQSYRERVVVLLEYLARRDERGSIEYINECAQDGVHMAVFTDEIVENLRKILLGQIQENLLLYSMEFSDDIEERFRVLMKAFLKEESLTLLQCLLENKPLFGKTSVEQFPLELAVMQYFLKHHHGPSDTTPPTPPVRVFSQEDSKKKTISPVSLDFSVLEAKWKDVISVASDFNHSLRLILSLLELNKVEGGVAHFFCPHKFHKEKLEDLKTRLILDKLFERVYGHTFDFVLELKSPDANTVPVSTPEENNTEELKQILEVFGGEVV